jgi:hypothetical protein
LPAALHGVWPFIWGLTEQMTYNGYLVARFQVLCRSTSVAIAVVVFAWLNWRTFACGGGMPAWHLLSTAPLRWSPGRVAASHNRPEVQERMNARLASVERLQADDVARAVAFVVTSPRHVAVNEVLMRPTEQQQ